MRECSKCLHRQVVSESPGLQSAITEMLDMMKKKGESERGRPIVSVRFKPQEPGNPDKGNGTFEVQAFERVFEYAVPGVDRILRDGNGKPTWAVVNVRLTRHVRKSQVFTQRYFGNEVYKTGRGAGFNPYSLPEPGYSESIWSAPLPESIPPIKRRAAKVCLNAPVETTMETHKVYLKYDHSKKQWRPDWHGPKNVKAGR